MKLALTVSPWRDEDLIFAQQLGVNHIIADIADTDRWDVQSLAAIRNRVEQAGLDLVAIESLPPEQYREAMLGQPGRDEEIDRVCQSIRNAGTVGIPLIGYRWTLPGRYRTVSHRPTGRGGAIVSAHDQSLIPSASLSAAEPVAAEEVWSRLISFLERVIPAAEAAGVKLACHPDDSPVPSGEGVASVLGTVDALERLLEVAPSACHGLDFCQGTVARMPGVDVIDAIRRFGRKQKILLVHLRNPKGTVASFTEAFLDEGDTDILRVLQAYDEVGFDGPIRAAPSPRIVGDTDWGHQGHAFSIGYLRALLQTAGRVPSITRPVA
ncbi:MAG: mannonate dehydratase [Chloroflexi bacterium]|nr:mannonate dehydratase [Chloroflexota bacterium]